MGTERRRFRRYVVESKDIHAKTVYATKVEVLNLSSGGACLKTTRSLKLGGNYLLKLTSGNSLIPVKCHVIWEVLAGSEPAPGGGVMPFYKAGIVFEETSSGKLIELERFMSASGIAVERESAEQNAMRALRFKIYGNEEAILNYLKSYHVRKLSLGGMLIQADGELKADEKYPMGLFLPGEATPIKFLGRIASCSAAVDVAPLRFDVGIEFLEMHEPDRTRLAAFIERL